MKADDFPDLETLNELESEMGIDDSDDASHKFSAKIKVIYATLAPVINRVSEAYDKYTNDSDPETLANFDGSKVVPSKIQEQMKDDSMMILGILDGISHYVAMTDKSLIMVDGVMDSLRTLGLTFDHAVRMFLPRNQFIKLRNGLMDEEYFDGRLWREHMIDMGEIVD